MARLPPVARFTCRSGARIYRLSCEAFPGLVTYAWLVLEAGPPTLVDTGSGYGRSNAELQAALDAVRSDFAESVRPADIRRIVITHGHIDHFGGLPFFHQLTGAEVAVHELDRRVLVAYEERVIVASKALAVFLRWAGVDGPLAVDLMDTYTFSKRHVRSVPVEQTLVDGQQLDGLRFIHVPGHCPGQVCIAVDDVLLSADHVLSRTTPHQSPESITAYTGLGHYLESLDKIAAAGPFELVLGGHEEPIADLSGRVDEIRASHVRKLQRVLTAVDAATTPLSISQITAVMYPDATGFDVLLALEEVGAHVEYLYQRGQLRVANLDEVTAEENPALRYEKA